ncbi:MRN complex-interacting protein-like [Limulus polyphemus]|uniref:MRN complex-interacting protein-like n=1 Tax=Limulus polyphemus TaxID=6850 RepID=A0ABM1B4Z4_LIMPO|nr:MRN complex-interacting protein-like [Limulus polyphemus]XP_022242075.1 MRN complex-interacting protein-like [Limulus polyphemus]XP_022242076.1 MRN complex-interacting protein-like [Limulus polyphemus]XP_022242077.1 MRN complex-interacting protein-like [Limulus polyphemus]XP_022242078.1 MRN complex-interacting protein-like [Limulus polyphemus]
MPQEFQVLRCFNCETFQVHLVKKSFKWNCKMCGEKQSIKQVYGKGSGFDCRKHVQKLNSLKGQLLEETKELLHLTEANSEDSELHDEKQLRANSCSGQSQKSKWAMFLDDCTQENSSVGDNTETFKCVMHQKKDVLLEKKSAINTDSCHVITKRWNEESVFNPAKKMKLSKTSSSEITNVLSLIQDDDVHFPAHPI